MEIEMKLLEIIKDYLDDGDCEYCPMLFTLLSFVLGVILGSIVW